MKINKQHTTITLKIESELRDKFEMLCAEQDRSMASALRIMIRNYVRSFVQRNKKS
jgi:hypothetical protein